MKKVFLIIFFFSYAISTEKLEDLILGNKIIRIKAQTTDINIVEEYIERPNNKWCLTTEKYAQSNPNNRSCSFQGNPDFPEIRDQHIPNESTETKTIRLFFHSFADDNGNNPTLTISEAEAQLQTLNEIFQQYKIQFIADFQIHHNSSFQLLSEEVYDSGQMHELYAMNPLVYHNVYVTDTGTDFQILGVSTFPWDNKALTIYGGTLIDKDWFGSPRNFNQQVNIPQLTVVHELGHGLGLWHTHRGIDEVNEECGDCYEGAYDFEYEEGQNQDVVGDLCSDTPATPTNYECIDPDDTDCQDNPFINTMVSNFMGYADDDCYNVFTPHQVGRMHGWIEEKLTTWIENSTTSTLINGSFEDGLSGWQVINNDNDDNSWSSILSTADYQSAYLGEYGAGIYYNPAGNDDWLISPKVYLNENLANISLSLWAKSYSPDWLESFNIYISTTENNIDSFSEIIGGDNNVPSEWAQYNYELDGYIGDSIYIAIQCNSVDSWYLFVDEIVLLSENNLSIDKSIIDNFSLSRIYPNPFNPVTNISYVLPLEAQISLNIYDIGGREITTLTEGVKTAGSYSIEWNAENYPSGVYFVKLDAGEFTQTQKLMLVK